MQQFDLWCAESQKSGVDFIVAMIDRILRAASECSASDVHFQPDRNGVSVRFRIDGVLHESGVLPLENVAQIAARLKVLAGLLTYKVDVPQEGRVRSGRVSGVDREMRISTAPTLFGERVAIRLFSEKDQVRGLESLGFDTIIAQNLAEAIRLRSGAVLITGPSGSGKTTTAYALLRELVQSNETLRSIVSLEDPVEHAIDGVAQIEVSSRSELVPVDAAETSRSLSLDRMLRYMMRQDPEVLMVGEIRQRSTAEAVFQAALTGHLLVSTFHAGGAVESISRFLELGIEPFVLRSSLAFVLCQRLFRRLCSCAEKIERKLEISLQGENRIVERYFESRGCSQCNGIGYRGRFPVAEVLPLGNEEVVHALLDRQSTGTIRRLAAEHGMVSLAAIAVREIENGRTSPIEAKRVLGN